MKKFGRPYFNKTDSINPAIDDALKNAVSKSGGSGGNTPDIRCLIEDSKKRRIPVMIEAKGSPNKLIKKDKNGTIVGVTYFDSDSKTHKKGDPNYSAIKGFAVNGAVHYANAILDGKGYEECIAIGANGWKTSAGDISYEISSWYISDDNQRLPKELGPYSDLSFLAPQEIDKLTSEIDTLSLTKEEIDALTAQTEADLDKKLRHVNQVMQDTLQINVNYRVNLISGMIMAGLGVENEVPPLTTSELKGYIGDNTHDGRVILNRISDFLNKKKLPEAKRQMIINNLSHVFIYDTLWKPEDGESKLKSIYRIIETEILPIFNSTSKLDFTGKLFNVLNEWVNVPDGAQNDVVLTPRYVTDLMAKLCRVNMNSYVWDYAAGSGGFLGVYTDAYLVGMRDGTRLTRESGLYLAAAVNASIHNERSRKYSRGNKATWENKVENDSIFLPVTDNGLLDYDYMSAYIRVQEKIAIADAVKLKDKIIAHTKNVIP